MNTIRRFGNLARTYFAVGAAVSALAILQTEIQTQALEKLRTRYKWVILIAVFAINVILGVYAAVSGRRPPLLPRIAIVEDLRRPVAMILGIILIALPAPLFLIARQDFFGSGVEAFFRLLWLFWWLVPLQVWGVRLCLAWEWERAFVAALLLDGSAAQLFTLSTAVSAYPFSMGWSEASRYYYGSLVFSQALYGEVLPLSVMHGSRYLLQSVPYLLHGIPLWGARLWQVMLWITLTWLSGWSVARRVSASTRGGALLLTTWIFLFSFQGAVYYHLQVCVILIMLGTLGWRPAISLVALVLSSFWAGMSRVNWFPVPAMLAITLYLLETPLGTVKHLWQYSRKPILWGIAGLLAALMGQAFYVAISRNTNLEAFASSFTSTLLWYRWLPSETNPIGILPGVGIVSAPVLALLAWRLHADSKGMHWMRLAGLATILTCLLAGGLVVSTKIGGGGDLHNMDAYLILLACLGAYALRGRHQLDLLPGRERVMAPPSIVLLMVLVPVSFSLLRLGSRFTYDHVRAAEDLRALGSTVQDYGRKGEVLFMYERHLQTFGMVPRVAMVPEYEVVTLMEMAISGNRAYLEQFYGDLQGHRFAAIVAHPQNLGVDTGDFIEENNAWSQWIAQPLLCQYKPILTLDSSKVQVLVPRDRPCSDFPPRFPGQ